MEDLVKLYDAVVAGNIDRVESPVRQLLDLDIPVERILNEVLLPAMTEVGDRFERNEYYIPNMLVSAEAVKKIMAILKPHLSASGAKPLGRVVIGTVHGDLHDIGKNLVAAMLEGSGFEVVDLGADVAIEAFVAAVKEGGADILAMSALLTTTMASMQEVIDSLVRENVRDQVKVMVGGAPLNRPFADKIGADGFSDSAGGAVLLARNWASSRGGVS